MTYKETIKQLVEEIAQAALKQDSKRLNELEEQAFDAIFRAWEEGLLGMTVTY